MIYITVTNGGLSVQGHAPRADNAPPGQNVVCAAVSALTLTLMEGLTQVAGMKTETDESIGWVRIRWESFNEIGKALIDTWYLGIERIRESYPGTITIS